MDVPALRRALHATPGTAGHEGDAARLIQEFLEGAGIPCTSGVGGHGVVARLDRGEGPHRLWRAELDALPHGHRCGHDGHAAMLAGALVQLADDPSWSGSITALFQPAEETGEGMLACLEHDALQGPFDEAAAFHNVPGAPLGAAILSPGCVASTGLRLTLIGEESHAAEPEQGLSPWPAMKQAADALATLQRPDGLATLVHVRLGEEAYGTSPGVGVVSATLRADTDEALAEMVSSWKSRIVEDDCDAEWEDVEPFPATRNDDAVIQRVRAAVQGAGLEVVERAEPFPWSEDFGHALKRWPGVLVGIGAGEEQPPLHAPDYVFPDGLLAPGMALWRALV